MEITEWSRECPKCGGTVYHSTKSNRDGAIRNGRTCGGKANLNCKVISKKQRSQLSKALKGRKPNHDQTARRKKSEPAKFTRNCPDCGKVLYYARDDNRKRADKINAICDGCANYKYKKTWNDVITEDGIKQMRAVKAGFSSWEEYEEKFPIWKRYKADVWKETYKSLRENPILENFDKRGRCGVEGAYQIDHIVGVRCGFDNGIPPKEIAKYSNLTMLPWKENLSKGKY